MTFRWKVQAAAVLVAAALLGSFLVGCAHMGPNDPYMPPTERAENAATGR